MKITKLEYDMLNKIAHNEHQPANTETPESFDDTDVIWASEIIESQEDKGVFSSLLKKGLVGFQKHHSKDSPGSVCWMTREGFDVWMRGFTRRPARLDHI